MIGGMDERPSLGFWLAGIADDIFAFANAGKSAGR
jgi:hypothetical protein